MRPKGSGTRLGEESLVKKHGWRKLSQGQWESLGHCLKQWGWGVVVPYSQNNARVWAWWQTLAIHNLRRQENFELEDSMGYLERLQDQKGCWGENEEGKLFKPLRDAFPGNTTDVCVCVLCVCVRPIQRIMPLGTVWRSCFHLERIDKETKGKDGERTRNSEIIGIWKLFSSRPV